MPWPVHPVGFFGSGDQDTYKVERSLRFNSADSAYLSRTPASAGNRKTFTISYWIKKTAILSSPQYLFSAGSGTTESTWFAAGTFDDNGTSFDATGAATWTTSGGVTTALFRDNSSWYHFVWAVDTTQSVAADRVKLWVNGVSQTLSASTITQNADLAWNNNVLHYIGARIDGGPRQFVNGYLAEVYNIDGQALTPSSFGETDPITGRWKAKRYAGTYGTNGFYLNFADNSGTTSTTLGKDLSGNGNNWTPNNFSVTAGVGNDSLLDSPTDSGASGNYCTWNPLVPGDSAVNGNLDVTNDTARGNQELMKYNSYWEVTSTGGTCLAGIISTAATSTVTVGSAKTFGFKLSTSGVFEYANVTDGSSFTSQATATTPPLVYASTGSGITASLNAGQRSFVATAPIGFKALCTTNLPTPTIKKPGRYMDVRAYTGTGASNSITGLDFSPDLVWIKNRGTTTNHAVYDTTRGTQLQLSTNTTGDEVTSSTGLTAFDTNGFTIGTSSLVNTNGTQYVAWTWDEAPIAGFDIVSYTGNGANRTVSHNLGVSPKMLIVKARTTASTDQGWPVWHTSIANTTYLTLSTTSATATGTDYWNSTSPTSSVFSLGTNVAVNANNDTYIAYLFAEVEGFSRFGSYTGNGSSDGPFVWCGFRPRWVMVKNTSASATVWCIWDTARDVYNLSTTGLQAQASTGDSTGFDCDITSSGFKIRDTEASLNGSGNTIIFAAFAESAFKYSRAR